MLFFLIRRALLRSLGGTSRRLGALLKKQNGPTVPTERRLCVNRPFYFLDLFMALCGASWRLLSQCGAHTLPAQLVTAFAVRVSVLF